MKAFHFRLESAMRWRATQLRLEQDGVSRAARLSAATEAALLAKHHELRSGSSRLVSAGSVAFVSWSAYAGRCQREIRRLEGQLNEARKALALQTRKMVEANQRMRVLENLRRDDHAAWEKELNREAEVFATEAFLAGVARTRAKPKQIA